MGGTDFYPLNIWCEPFEPVDDSFDLQRFIEAQATIYPRVAEELSHWRKRTHWRWFVFPQIAGLGFSAMAQRFAIGSPAEEPPHTWSMTCPDLAWSNARGSSWRRAKTE